MTVKIGDWVRFYRNGALVIGIVNYRRRRDEISSEWILSTDAGEVNEDEVLERRSVEEPTR